MRKILVIRFSSIGDIVLTTPVIRCLKAQLPGIRLHYLVKEQYAPILNANPHIDRIYAIGEGIGEVIQDLKKEKYDFIVDLHGSLRSLDVKRRLRRPSANFPKLNVRKWLLVRLKKVRMPDIHIVDRYFRAVKPLGVINDGAGLEYFIPDNDRVDISEILGSLGQELIVFVIGARHFTKVLPEHKIVSICSRLDKTVILLGGPEDRERGERIALQAGKHVFNACGRFNINQSAFIVSQASLVITHDTGLMHIASAFRKRIISIWGNTVPELGMYPYLPGDESLSTLFEVSGLPCRPCSKIGFDRCPKGHFDCMEKIDVEGIISIANAGGGIPDSTPDVDSQA